MSHHNALTSRRWISDVFTAASTRPSRPTIAWKTQMSSTQLWVIIIIIILIPFRQTNINNGSRTRIWLFYPSCTVRRCWHLWFRHSARDVSIRVASRQAPVVTHDHITIDEPTTQLSASNSQSNLIEIPIDAILRPILSIMRQLGKAYSIQTSLASGKAWNDMTPTEHICGIYEKVSGSSLKPHK